MKKLFILLILLFPGLLYAAGPLSSGPLSGGGGSGGTSITGLTANSIPKATGVSSAPLADGSCNYDVSGNLGCSAGIASTSNPASTALTTTPPPPVRARKWLDPGNWTNYCGTQATRTDLDWTDPSGNVTACVPGSTEMVYLNPVTKEDSGSVTLASIPGAPLQSSPIGKLRVRSSNNATVTVGEPSLNHQLLIDFESVAGTGDASLNFIVTVPANKLRIVDASGNISAAFTTATLTATLRGSVVIWVRDISKTATPSLVWYIRRVSTVAGIELAGS